jgi:vacuolar protein sorting-associated protein 11
MYLETAKLKSTPASEKEAWQRKAKELITSQPQISSPSNQPAEQIPTSSVLLLSSLSNFPTGTTLVRERANLYADIFRSHTSINDTSGAISALHKYGPEDPATLYPIALSYFSSTPEILSSPGVEEELQSILRKIDQDNLMAPLQVVKVLSQGGAVNIGVVKSYLSENIARERSEIRNNRALIESYRSETAAKKSELEDLGSKPIVFQARRCSACGGPLDLPTVHFLCKHSFHQRCLNSGAAQDVEASGGKVKAECPVCKPQNDTIKAIRRAQVESAEQHDLFGAVLERSKERFGTVSEFFGRGVMNVGGPVVE